MPQGKTEGLESAQGCHEALRPQSGQAMVMADPVQQEGSLTGSRALLSSRQE